MTLVCPSCGREHADEERFCTGCGLPLVPAGGPSEAQLGPLGERARKVKRQYAEGELVLVKVARQQPEAEFIQSLLLEHGIPSTLRRTRGFDLPEMLAAGPRDVMVPASGAEAARETLRQAEVTSVPARATQPPVMRAVAGALLAIIALGALATILIRVLA